MLYTSLDQQHEQLSFTHAVLKGQSSAKGLYFPNTLPHYNNKQLVELLNLPRTERAFRLLRPYTDESIGENSLYTACESITSFDIPLRALTSQISILELYHGPTLAFKDVGARFIASILDAIHQKNAEYHTVLVATSGDTGGAVANAFQNAQNTRVVILYPKNGVSPLQELQLTTNGHSVFAIEVDGDFDRCQEIVKSLFADPMLQKKYGLISANSINIARWLPQQIYYFDALSQWPHETPPTIAVPSGNFGNIAAGLLAACSGLRIQSLIAACNSNDTIPRYLSTGQWQPRSTHATLSNAMDISVPSNFVRISEMLQNHKTEPSFAFKSTSISDEKTRTKMKQCVDEFDYWVDPHTAVGLCALDELLESGQKAICLSTAHPIKFKTTVEDACQALLPDTSNIESALAVLPQRKFQMAASTEDVLAFFKAEL